MRIKQGENKSYKFYVYEKGGTTPILLRPQNIVFTAELTASCGEVAKIVKELDNGITFDETDGKYIMSFAPEDTINLPLGNYGFDIKIKRSDKQYFVVYQGYLKIVKSYTGVI